VQHVSIQRSTTALLDGGHDIMLTQAQMRVLPPSRPMGTEDTRDLQCGTHREYLHGIQSLQRTDHLAQDLGG
jgi:hypothetical protein